MWNITGQTLVNHHHAQKYEWGLEETVKNSGIFYIKDKVKCTGTEWYPVQKPVPPKVTDLKGQTQTINPQNLDPNNKSQGRNKRAVPAVTMTCPTQTQMDHEITSQEYNKTNKRQMWKMEPKNPKKGSYFKLCLEEEKKPKTGTNTEAVKQEDPNKPKIDTKTCVSATNKANDFESKQDCGDFIAANVENFRTFEGNTRKVISVLLGFFVATIIKRWWDQTSKIPRLEKLAISLNAMLQEGKHHVCKNLGYIVLVPLKLCLTL